MRIVFATERSLAAIAMEAPKSPGARIVRFSITCKGGLLSSRCGFRSIRRCESAIDGVFQRFVLYDGIRHSIGSCEEERNNGRNTG